MKIEFVSTYDLWNLKKLSSIENIFKGLSSSPSLTLDVRGCAFDYISAPSLVTLSLEHLSKSPASTEGKLELTIIFEVGVCEDIASEFFGALVPDEPEKTFNEAMDKWCEKNDLIVVLQKFSKKPGAEMIATYGAKH
jgi:hypothetical protein